jgi:hypothetical protein
MIKNLLLLLGLIYLIGTFVEVSNLRKQVQLLENNYAECTYYHERALAELERIKKEHRVD